MHHLAWPAACRRMGVSLLLLQLHHDCNPFPKSLGKGTVFLRGSQHPPGTLQSAAAAEKEMVKQDDVKDGELPVGQVVGWYVLV